MVLLVGDAVAAVEAGQHAEGQDDGFELHHLFIFDLAWPVFLVTLPIVLVAGVAALVTSRLRPSQGLGRFAAMALGYVALAIGILAATGALEI